MSLATTSNHIDSTPATRERAGRLTTGHAPAAAPPRTDLPAVEHLPEPPAAKKLLTFTERLDAFFSRLSVKNNFWHRVCALVWLPFAFKSGIKMKRLDAKTFAAVLPFRRFNRNWYNAMAGAALLGNAEVAGGMYVFGVCGGDYTVVCKHLEYKFLRPCLGPVIYKMNPRQDIHELLKAASEFNITLDLDVHQQSVKKGHYAEHRVGRCVATFHVTPKQQHRDKKARRDA